MWPSVSAWVRRLETGLRTFILSGSAVVAVSTVGCQRVGRAVADDGRSGEQHARRGAELFAAQQCEQAIPELGAALFGVLTADERRTVLTQLGACHERSGEFEDAAAMYERALELEPGAPNVWGQLGVVRRKQGRRADARRCYATALALDPANDEVLASYGALLVLEGEPERAIVVLEQAVSLDGRHPTVHVNLSVAYADAGRIDEARRSVERAVVLGYPAARLVALRRRVEGEVPR